LATQEREGTQRGSTSQQQNAMREMEPQRREKGINSEKRLASSHMGRPFSERQTRNRRQLGLECRSLRTSIRQIEKDARGPLAFARGLMVAIGAAGADAIVATVPRVGMRRFHPTRRDATGAGGVRVVAAATEHRMQCQQRGHQG
jgi:hypothetical protein